MNRHALSNAAYVFTVHGANVMDAQQNMAVHLDQFLQVMHSSLYETVISKRTTGRLFPQDFAVQDIDANQANAQKPEANNNLA
ncbi:MAG: hypothetical protein JWR60_693 [Polaromonas sp.]|nr:hypothetical protein [Polaromonas sp.]